MRPSELIRLLKKNNFQFDHHGTNHDFYIKDGVKVMVERHNKEIDNKTLNKILKDAGLK